jgi:hypothetical protein
VHRLSGKIISSLPMWLLITMMIMVIMVILTRDLAGCRRPVLMIGCCTALLWAILAGPAAGRRFRAALASYCVPGSVLQPAL